MINRSDSVEFEYLLKDGKTVYVSGSGKFVPAYYGPFAEIKNVYTRVWIYNDPEDIDGKELIKQDIPEDWELIERRVVKTIFDSLE